MATTTHTNDRDTFTARQNRDFLFFFPSHPSKSHEETGICLNGEKFKPLKTIVNGILRHLPTSRISLLHPWRILAVSPPSRRIFRPFTYHQSW
jgi:hypothetical protein